MTTARNFLDRIVLDHQFTHTKVPSPGNAHGMAHIVNMSCSCGWSTGRAVSLREETDGYATSLTSEWSDREQLQHLLDQELSPKSMLQLIAKGLS